LSAIPGAGTHQARHGPLDTDPDRRLSRPVLLWRVGAPRRPNRESAYLGSPGSLGDRHDPVHHPFGDLVQPEPTTVPARATRLDSGREVVAVEHGDPRSLGLDDRPAPPTVGHVAVQPVTDVQLGDRVGPVRRGLGRPAHGPQRAVTPTTRHRERGARLGPRRMHASTVPMACWTPREGAPPRVAHGGRGTRAAAHMQKAPEPGPDLH
jgi:hypothetical protein